MASLSQLLSAQKDNPYKVRAYQGAASSIRNLSDSVRDLVQREADLTAYPGIGRAIDSAIREIVLTGTLGRLEQLRSESSPELITISDYPGLNPKRILRIYKKLTISSIAELRKQSKPVRLNDASTRRFVVQWSNTTSMRTFGRFRDQLALKPPRVRLRVAFQISRQDVNRTFRLAVVALSFRAPNLQIPFYPKSRSYWHRREKAHVASVVRSFKNECLCRSCTSPFSIPSDKRFAEYVDQFPSLRAKSVQHGVTLHFSASIETFCASHF